MTVTAHAAAVVLTMVGDPIEDGAVLVEGGTVVAVGPRSDFAGERVRDWPGVLTPVLVNAHAHLQHGPASGDGADLTETDWQVSARGSAHQLLKSGTTAVADVTTRPEAIAVATSLGLQGISYVAGSALLGVAGRGRGISPPVLDAEAFRELCGLARARGLRLHHSLAGAGPAAVRRCHDLGGLGPDVHVAHAGQVDADDRALLRASGTAVVLCTRASAVPGESPVAAYLDEGNAVALGTDSLASAPDLDLWAVALATRDLARKQGLDGCEEQLVRAATLGGAAAMGLPLGTLEVGGCADLAAFAVPSGDPYRALVEHGAGSCVATVVGGRLVHRR